MLSTGTVVLGGTGSTVQAVFGTGTVVLAGSGSTVQSVFGTGTMVLTGTGSTVQAQFGTGTMVLTGSGSTVQAVFGTGTVVLTGSGSTVQMADRTATTTSASTTIILGASAATILAQNTSRNYAGVSFANSTLFLGFGTNVPTTNSFSLVFTQPGLYEINRTNLFQGQLQAVMGAASSTLGIVEW